MPPPDAGCQSFCLQVDVSRQIAGQQQVLCLQHLISKSLTIMFGGDACAHFGGSLRFVIARVVLTLDSRGAEDSIDVQNYLCRSFCTAA
jgi:hypothetical protein